MCFDQIKDFNDLDEQLQRDVVTLTEVWCRDDVPNPIIGLHRTHLNQAVDERLMSSKPSAGLIAFDRIAVVNGLASLLMWQNDEL